MIVKDYFYGDIKGDELSLNMNELAARLNVNREYTDEFLNVCIEKVRKELRVKYCGVRAEVTYPQENTLNIGSLLIKSADLYKNFKGANETFIFAVTLGHNLDRLIGRLAVSSIAEHFICDAVASAFAESAADKTEEIIKKDFVCRPRYSVGYGDLSLSYQPFVLDAVSAGKLLNINIGENLLMSPSKSVTAFMATDGISDKVLKKG